MRFSQCPIGTHERIEIDNLSDLAKIAYWPLRFSMLRDFSGIYRLSMSTVAALIGRGKDEAKAVIGEICQARLAVYDESVGLIWFPDCIKAQMTKSPKIIGPAVDYIMSLPESPIIPAFISACRAEGFAVDDAMAAAGYPIDTLSDTLSIPQYGLVSSRVISSGLAPDRETKISHYGESGARPALTRGAEGVGGATGEPDDTESEFRSDPAPAVPPEPETPAQGILVNPGEEPSRAVSKSRRKAVSGITAPERTAAMQVFDHLVACVRKVKPRHPGWTRSDKNLSSIIERLREGCSLTLLKAGAEARVAQAAKEKSWRYLHPITCYQDGKPWEVTETLAADRMAGPIPWDDPFADRHKPDDEADENGEIQL